MIIAILFLALVLRLVNLNQSFWLDEAAQVIESSRPFLKQFDLAADFHPPLYHLLLHFWLYLGQSEIWVRLLSVGFALGSIVLIYQLGRTLIDKKVAIVSAFLLSISPYHIWYSQETRPYMAFVFFSLLSTLFLLRKKWKWYLIALILSLYTNYFTFFLLAGQSAYIIFLEKKYIKNFIISGFISLILFGLWLPELLRQLTIGTSGFFSGWTDVVSVSPVKTIVLTFAKFIFGRGTIENNYIYAVVILPVFLLFIFSLIRTWREKSAKILITLFFVPFATSEIISFFISINAPQRLIFLLPIFYLILASGIYNLPRKIQLVTALIVLLTNMGGLYQYYTDPSVQREQWREAVAFTEKEKGPPSAALFIFPGAFAPYTWYAKGKIDAWGISPKFILTDDDLAKLSMKLATKNKLYLYQYLTGLTDPQSKTQKFLSSSGFSQTDVRNFPGVGFVYILEK